MFTESTHGDGCTVQGQELKRKEQAAGRKYWSPWCSEWYVKLELWRGDCAHTQTSGRLSTNSVKGAALKKSEGSELPPSTCDVWGESEHLCDLRAGLTH